MDNQKRIVLLVTGSIAAKTRTEPLIEALRKDGYVVTVLLTKAPEEWKWVSPTELKKDGVAVLTETSPLSAKEKALVEAQTILVAPATADFISQLATDSSELASLILSARRGNERRKERRLVIVPAMNTKMWQHPAMQRNCAALKNLQSKDENAQVNFLGPCKGILACHDEGFGKMLGVKEIVDGIEAVTAGRPSSAVASFEIAREEGLIPIPFRPAEESSRVVVVLGGGRMDWPTFEKLAGEIAETKKTADYVADPLWAKHKSAIEKLTGQTVITDYYQIPEFEGLEHIKLPERASCVFFPFLDKEMATAMEQGRANTLGLSIYLASKVPVVTTTRCLEHLSPVLADRLRRDGLRTIDSIGELKHFPEPSPAVDTAPH